MTYRIVIDGRKIDTDDDVPKLLDYGRTAAGFIHVTDTDGLDVLVNVAHIVAVVLDAESDGRIIIDEEESR